MVYILFAPDLAEATGIVGDAIVDALHLEGEECLGKVVLQMILEGGYEDLLLTPRVTDAIGVEHQRDGKRTQRLIVDGDKTRGVRLFAMGEGVAIVEVDALAERVGERKVVGLEIVDNKFCEGIGDRLRGAVIGGNLKFDWTVAVVEKELDEVTLRGVEG